MPEKTQEKEHFENILYPNSFDEYIGQERLKEKLRIAITASKERDEPLTSICINGIPGIGKSSIAKVIANEYGTECKTIMAPSVKSVADLLEVLTKLAVNSILHIDEIHGLNIKLQESLYPSMVDFKVTLKLARNQLMHIDINPYCLIGTTTKLGDLSEPLRNRFGIIHTLEEYNDEQITALTKANAEKLKIRFENEQLYKNLANCSRGIPRNVNRLLSRIRDYAQVKNHNLVSEQCLRNALDLEGIYDGGFTQQDVKYMQVLYEKFAGGPTGVNNICSTMGEDKNTVESVIEPFLLRKDLLVKLKNGRMLTVKAMEYLFANKPKPLLN